MMAVNASRVAISRRRALQGLSAGAAAIAAQQMYPSKARASTDDQIIVDAADPRFGSTRDQNQINAAIEYVGARGGGTVSVSRVGGPWRIARADPADQKTGGILIEYPNVTLTSDGAVLSLVDNCDFIAIRSPVAGVLSMEGTEDAATFTVSSEMPSDDLTGGVGVLTAGQAAYDPSEPSGWGFTRIESIDPSGALQLVGAAEVDARSGARLTVLKRTVSNVSIEGRFYLTSPAAGSANAETGISLVRVRNVSISARIIADNPGAGALCAQYSEDVYVDSVLVRTAAMQDGQSSKGRGVSLAECNRVRIRLLEIRDFDGAAVVAEAGCADISIGTLRLLNLSPVRASSSVPLLHLLGSSQVDVDYVVVDGGPAYFYEADDASQLSVLNATFRPSAAPTIQDLGVIVRRFSVAGNAYFRRRTIELTVPIRPGMHGESLPLPTGYYFDFDARVSTLDGIRGIYLGSDKYAVRIDDKMSPGVSTTVQQGVGFGSGYPASFSTQKQISCYSSDNLPVGTTLQLKIGYYVV